MKSNAFHQCALMPCILLVGCMAGCAVTNTGNGSFFMTYGTTLEFGMRTQVMVPDQVSTLEVNFDGLFGMIQAFYKEGPVDGPKELAEESSPPVGGGGEG